ncbi:MAG: acyltransferase [Anaerolineales bacterium]|nr:acyltransferase [Anaerolineales bacterium]
MSQKNEKLAEFEILRAVCIIFLMFVHSDIFSTYLFGVKLEPIGPYMGAFMLGAFFFMAGYFVEYSHRRRPQSFLNYLWAKFIRLFPPYWLALFAFMTILQFSLKRPDFILYFLDLQIIFSPAFIKPLLTLWYLSAIFIYYLTFGVFLSRSTRSLAGWSIFIFAVAYFLNYQYDLFDDRFFEYFFVFLAGVLLARYDELRNRIFLAPLPLQLAVGLVGAILFGVFEFGDYRTRHLGYLFASNLYILSWIALALRLFRNNWLHWRIWSPISYASFFAYLFHRPIWEIMFKFLPVPEQIHPGWLRLFPGSIIVFGLCYGMQLMYDLVLRTGSDFWKRRGLKTA